MGMLLCCLTGETLKEVCTSFNISIKTKNKLIKEMTILYHELNSSNTVKINNLILSRIKLKQDFINKVKTFGDHKYVNHSIDVAKINRQSKFNCIHKHKRND
jgi:hypothetical protein